MYYVLHLLTVTSLSLSHAHRAFTKCRSELEKEYGKVGASVGRVMMVCAEFAYSTSTELDPLIQSSRPN